MSKKMMCMMLVLAALLSLFCIGVSAAEDQAKLAPAPAVNAAPEPKNFSETEDNDDFPQADRVYNNYLIQGNAVGYEMDIFVFTLTERSDVSIVSGTAKEDFTMVLCDSSTTGFAVAEDDGYEDGYYYDVLYYWLEPGTYYIATGDLNENLSSKYPYEIYLHWEPHAHYWDDGVVTTQPTYTSTGIRTYTCMECGDTKTAVEPVIPHNHVYIDTVIPADCVYAGYTLHKCDLCGSSYTDNIKSNLGHNWANGTCYRCGTKWEDQFVDVPKTEYYYEPVMWAVDNSITAGSGLINTFEPNANCTRAQVVTFLYRAAGEPRVSGVSPFADVKSTDWFHNAVLWAVEEGITVGVGGNRFGADETCTRAQVATFLYRAAGEPGHSVTANPFIDLKEDWYVDPVLWAYENGITKGDGAENTFNPDGKCIRAQIVTFLQRAANIEPSVEASLVGVFAPDNMDVEVLFYDNGTCFVYEDGAVAETTYTIADGAYYFVTLIGTPDETEWEVDASLVEMP